MSSQNHHLVVCLTSQILAYITCKYVTPWNTGTQYRAYGSSHWAEGISHFRPYDAMTICVIFVCCTRSLNQIKKYQNTYFSPKVITKPCDHAKELSREAEHTAYACINKEDFNTLNRVVWAWFRKQVLSLNLLWSCFTHYVWCHELGHCRHRGFEFNGLLRCMMSWTKILRHKWKVNDQTCSECQTIHRTAW